MNSDHEQIIELSNAVTERDATIARLTRERDEWHDRWQVASVEADTNGMQRDAINSSICDARDFAYRYGGIEGSHHKQWVIDQMLRKMLGPEEYATFVAEYGDEPGYEGEPWNKGIAP